MEALRDHLGTGPPTRTRATLSLAPRRLLLGLRDIAGVGVRLLLVLERGLGGYVAARDLDRVGDRPRDERDGTDRVVVARDRHGQHVGVRVGVGDGHDRDLEPMRLPHGDLLLLRVHHVDHSRQPGHVLDAGQVALELLPLALQQELLLLRVVLEDAFLAPALQLLQPADVLLDRLEVGEHAAQPALGDVERPAALRLAPHDLGQLGLGAHEQGGLAGQHRLAGQLLRPLQLPQGLLQIDQVDSAALGEDVPSHLRVPARGLMPEVDPRLQELLEADLPHLESGRRGTGIVAHAIASRTGTVCGLSADRASCAPPHGGPASASRGSGAGRADLRRARAGREPRRAGPLPPAP